MKASKDFNDWLNSTYKKPEDKNEFLNKNYIPIDIALSFDNFYNFFIKWKKLIKEKLKEILQ